MIDTPHITSSPAQMIACVHLTISRDEIRHVMGPGITEVFSVLSAQDIKPTGPWFTHHLRRPTDTFDFKICVPIATPVMETGRVKQGEVPARTQVARAVYSGPYESLAGAWSELMQWLEANGHMRADDLWECYTVGPESSPDSANWRTELNQPLID